MATAPVAPKKQSFFETLTNAIYLDYVLQIVGAAVVLITVWKSVHGFFPSLGIIAGAAAIFVGKHFTSIYR